MEIERNILDEERSAAFHHAVAQLMFAMPQSKKYVQTYVLFLTNRVREHGKDD